MDILKQVIGQGPAILNILELVAQVGPFNTTVLLTGESGTGKEGIANCIVQRSKRSNLPYIKINCAAIPSTLVEAELFGYEKGAFTGAYESRPGKFEQASGGTILLDEIGEMPFEMQSKLLRFLQDKEIQRIGSNLIKKTDVRIIAATSRNLEMEVAAGNFRADLYYRLLVFPIALPPLRERKEDIPALVAHFVQYYANNTGKNITRVDVHVMEKLINYHWPGNIRELQHLIERSILLSKGTTISEIMLPGDPVKEVINNRAIGEDIAPKDMERSHLVSALRYGNFKISGKGGAAELLNLSPAILYARIKKLGITKTYTFS